MISVRIIRCIFILPLIHFNAFGQAKEVINLECSVERTINMDDGTTSPTSGINHLQIFRRSDGSLEITRNNKEKYWGSADEIHYKGAAQYEFSGLRMNESISINRYTGQFEIDLKSSRGSGLRHMGICKPASRKF